MRADWIKVMIAAARFPLRSDPANNQLNAQVPKCPRSDLALHLIAVCGHSPIYQVGPDISTVGFLLPGRQHRYRRCIGVNLRQRHFA